jgi:hypothetical protein
MGSSAIIQSIPEPAKVAGEERLAVRSSAVFHMESRKGRMDLWMTTLACSRFI